MFGFNPNKCKTACGLCIGRVKLMRNKRQLTANKLRKEVADLLRAGKFNNARIRVESVLREELTLQAYDLLELYLEQVKVRCELLAATKELPPDTTEAVVSIIYAAARCSADLDELAGLRTMLGRKYEGVHGPNFAKEVSSDETCAKWGVSDTLVACLSVAAPRPAEKLALLTEIATQHGVPFDTDAAAREMLPGAYAAAAAASAEAMPPIPAPFGNGVGGGVAMVPPLALAQEPPPSARRPPAASAASTTHPEAPDAAWASPRPVDPAAVGKELSQNHESLTNWLRAAKQGSGGSVFNALLDPGSRTGSATPGDFMTDSPTAQAGSPAAEEAEYPDAASALAASRRFKELAQRAELEAHRLAGAQAVKGSRVPDSPEQEPAEEAAEEAAAAEAGEEYPDAPANPTDAESLDDELSRRLAALRQAD